jgi:hypothetical protein
MTKLIITGCIIISGLLGFGTVRLLNVSQEAGPAANNAGQQEKPSRFEKLRIEATKIQPGVMTDKQKEHSKLYKTDYYKIDNAGTKLVDRGKGIHDVRVALGPPIPNPSHYVFKTPQEFLHQLSCKSDAVVVVQVLDKVSQLTEGEAFLFSDYSVKVIELLKNNEKDSIDLDSVLTVTRPGGLVEINGRIIQAIDAKYEELRKGKEYLLFLSYIPTTKSYQAVDAKSSFDLQAEDGSSVNKLTSYPTPLDQLKEFKNRDVFIPEVKNAVSLSCPDISK